MRDDRLETVGVRLTATQRGHCDKTGNRSKYIRELIDRDIRGGSLESFVRMIVREVVRENPEIAHNPKAACASDKIRDAIRFMKG